MGWSVQAWVADAAGARLRPERLRLPGLAPGDVLVRVAAAGVCHTDIAWVDGSRPSPFPLVAGHEGAGTVVAVGSAVAGVAVGDRVAMSFASCGACRSCLRGRPSYCASFRHLNSGFGGGLKRFDRASGEAVTTGFFGQSSFADHALTSVRNLVPLPADVPFEVAAPFGCGIQTGAGAVLHSLAVGAGDTLAVFGAGAVGLSAVMAARVAGAEAVIAVDPVPARRRLAVELGATHAATPEEVAAGALRTIVPDGLDHAIDTTGRPEVIRSAVEATHTTGSVGLIGSGPAGTEVRLALRDLMVGRRIRGIVEGDSVPQVFIPALLGLRRAGRFPADALITTFAGNELNEAMHAMRTGSAVKPVVVFDNRD